MIDRKKVIRGLEWCIEKPCHPNCPYFTAEDCLFTKILPDALALLKEQEEGIAPIESTRKQKEFADKIGIAVSDFWCGACHFNLVGHPKFCPNCGKRVKWND